MRHRPVSLTFLIESLAKNLQYVFLVVQSLSLLGVINFDLNPNNFPILSITSEINIFSQYTYNPVFIYGHYLYIFLLIAKGFALSFIDALRNNTIASIIIALLIVNIWLLYKRKTRTSDSVLKKITKSIWRESNIFERSLWMIFFIDLMVFITSPKKLDILFLLILYLLFASIRFVPFISGIFIELTEKIEKSVFHNKKVLYFVTFIDIFLIYFDSSSIFTLFLITMVYNSVAYLVMKFLKEFKKLWDYAFYVFNFGMLIFFFSILLIYWISFFISLILQSPLVLYNYYKRRKFIPENWMEIANAIYLIIFLLIFFI